MEKNEYLCYGNYYEFLGESFCNIKGNNNVACLCNRGECDGCDYGYYLFNLRGDRPIDKNLKEKQMNVLFRERTPHHIYYEMDEKTKIIYNAFEFKERDEQGNPIPYRYMPITEDGLHFYTYFEEDEEHIALDQFVYGENEFFKRIEDNNRKVREERKKKELEKTEKQ